MVYSIYYNGTLVLTLERGGESGLAVSAWVRG